MIFLEKEKKEKIYVLDKKEIVENYKNKAYMVFYDSENLKSPMINDSHVIFIGTDLLNFPVLQEDGTLREATDKELIEKGIAELHEFEVLVGDTAKSIYEFPISENLVKPIFDKETLQWVESATMDEIITHEEKEKEIFYNGELGLATKAHTEYDMGMISDTEYNEVKDYINAINPYKMKSVRAFSFLALPTVKRPALFERYENKL